MEFLLVLIIIAVICSRSIRVLKPGRSLIVFQNGTVVKAVNSDVAKVAWLLPFIQTSRTLDISKKLVSIPDFFDQSDVQTPLVRGSFEYQITDSLRAVNNNRLNADMEALVIDCLRRVLVDATIELCLMQKAEVEMRTIVLSKLRSATLGVALTAVNIKSFPLHRRLLIQITTLPYVVYWQLVEEMQ